MDAGRDARDSRPSSGNTETSGRQNRVLAAPILRFDLRTEVDQLRRMPSYDAGEPTGKTLVKEPDLRIVLMALRSGARLEEHHASGPISIQAIDGRLRFRTPEESTELSAGQLLALEPAIPHDVEAIDDTAFLLTIGRTTYQNVSDQHERRAEQ